MAEIMPETGEREDLLAWYKMRDVYREFKANRISKEEGESRRRSAFHFRAENIERIAQYARTQKRMADFWRAIECAASDYMKDRTLAHADTLIETIYGTNIIKRRTEGRSDAEKENDNSGSGE